MAKTMSKTMSPPESDTDGNEERQETPSFDHSSNGLDELTITSSLEDLQTDEQRRVLDTVAQVRKCGLESILSLPQLVVCGDQSAGKSSVLEALTEIPFPRNDNLCTRFATEISLRRSNANSLTIKVIPDENRPAAEKTKIKEFEESITNFDDLPRIMGLAMSLMGIDNSAESDSKPQAFARDTLSIEIEGPTRPQLTVVDIPGIIQTKTKGITDADISLVNEITDHYIKQPRTICLAVVAATNDYANQKILEKVRDVDPKGRRTLGIITKPDRLDSNSGSEQSFIELAGNKDIFFELGWHVLKNRKFDESDFDLLERNMSENKFFRNSNFKTLPKEYVGIEALRRRLAVLLFEHVKHELPKLRQDLEKALCDAREQLDLLGAKRSSAVECRAYLAKLSLEYYEISKAAVNGHYENSYFHRDIDPGFSIEAKSTLSRTRAVVQAMNTKFSDNMRKYGHKFSVHPDEEEGDAENKGDREVQIDEKGEEMEEDFHSVVPQAPENIKKQEALAWVRQVLVRNRGKELLGNYNPLLVGELFWEQSCKWREIAENHLEAVATVCGQFLKNLLRDKCPQDVESRLWSSRMEDELRSRKQAALSELGLLMDDLQSYPQNYNHYYTDTIMKRRDDRQRETLMKCVDGASTGTRMEGNVRTANIGISDFLTSFFQSTEPDMDKFSCEEALDCLFAIYKARNPSPKFPYPLLTSSRSPRRHS